MPDVFLDADALRASTFVRHVEIHDTLGSTSDRAAELAREPGIALPALVAARLQTAGRGRGKNVWHSADGALTFSILLEPAALGIGTQNWPQLSLTTAVAVCDALAPELNPQSEIRNPKSADLAIKWPNDVMLDGAKVAGILIESPGGPPPAKNRLVIGIGINVNNSWNATSEGAAGAATPAGSLQTATSLRDTTGCAHDLQLVLSNVVQALERRTGQLARLDPQLPAAWQQFCWLAGQRVKVETDGTEFEGVCLGIDVDGSLRMQNDVGVQRLNTGSVRVAKDECATDRF